MSFSDIPRGQQLTDERIKSMDIGPELWPQERHLLLTLLFNREAAPKMQYNPSAIQSFDTRIKVGNDTHTFNNQSFEVYCDPAFLEEKEAW